MSADRQEFGPFSFDAPSAWTRRPVLVLGEPGSSRQILIGRDQRPESEPLASLAWRRLYEMARTDTSRELVDARATTIAGAPAFRAVVDRPGPAARMRETIAWVDAGEGAVLVATATTTADDAGEVFDEMLASMRLSPAASRVAASPSQSASSPPPRGVDSGVYDSFPMPQARAPRR